MSLSIGDVLRSVRGFYAAYDRDYTYLGVRGFLRSGDYNSRILLLINGHRLNDNVFDSALLGTEFPLDLDRIDRIEIVRGPSSSLLGTNAVFGVINVITRKPKRGTTVGLTGETSSFLGRAGSLTLALQSGKLSALTSGSIYRSNGDSDLFFPQFAAPETNYGFAHNLDSDDFGHALVDLQYANFRTQGLFSKRAKTVPTAAHDTVFNDPTARSRDISYHRAVSSNADLDVRGYYDSYDSLGTGAYSSGPAEAAIVAKSLLQSLAEPFQVDSHQLTIATSIGISTFPEDATIPADLMQQADGAMYAAKRNGKNCAMYFTKELGSFVRERLKLENLLRGAIARGEVSVHYQPEFDVSSKRLVRFEALARWTHPVLGAIPPAKFIPIAEESGIIVTLGTFVLEQACFEAIKWQKEAASSIQVAVNVSSIQFAREHFVEEVTEILQHTGLPSHLLQLELTESVMLHGVNRSADTMERLKALGVSLAIDDFGTGYSCLSYLPTLPSDALKIDRSFVKELDTKAASEAMIHTLVTLAHDIGMRVIVEGVETPEQLDLIKRFGGNEVQGYLLGRPTPNPAQVLDTEAGKDQLNEKNALHETENLPTLRS